MGNVIAADALRLAALRRALGCATPEGEADFPEALTDMTFDPATIELSFDGGGAVSSIVLRPKQIPSDAQKVISGALADGMWRQLHAISLVGKQLLESTADLIVESTRARPSLGFFGGATEVGLSPTILQPADVKLMVATLSRKVEVRALLLSGCELGPAAMRGLAPPLGTHATLGTLDLDGNPLGDEGAVALAGGLAANRSLKTVSLLWCNVRDEGARALGAALATNTALEALEMTQTSSFAPHWRVGGPNKYPEGCEALARGVLANTTSLRSFNAYPTAWLRIEWGAAPELPEAAALSTHPAMTRGRKPPPTSEPLLAAERAAVDAQAGAESGHVLRRLIGPPGRSVIHEVHARTLAFVAFATVGVPDALATSGVVYYELRLTGRGHMQLGFASKRMAVDIDSEHGDGVGDDDGSWAVDGFEGVLWNGGPPRPWEGKWLPDGAQATVVGLALNVKAGKMATSIDGDWAAPGCGVVFTDASMTSGVYPAFTAKGVELGYRMAAPFEFAPPPDALWG